MHAHVSHRDVAGFHPSGAGLHCQEVSVGAVRGFLRPQDEIRILDELREEVQAGRSATDRCVAARQGWARPRSCDLSCGRRRGEFRIAEVAGVESEMELPYAGPAPACSPMLDHLHALPEPQQRALSIAFGMTDGDAPDRLLLGLATLSLLAEVAEPNRCCASSTTPMWLDDASGEVLGFVARRLAAESVSDGLRVADRTGPAGAA
jgi:hypothetical protein